MCVMLTLVLGVSLFACAPDENVSGKDSANETVPLVFSVQELDNVFNPFFGSSGYDIEITGNTQISMLSADGSGEVACGATEPSVVMDYSQIITYTDESGTNTYDPNKGETPDLGGQNPEDIPEDMYYTTYRFLIKNNIKFSDGTPLTIKDVLFNMYVYLDPTYSGSSTMYSTDIKGLTAYRTQDPNANPETERLDDSLAMTRAKERLDTIRNAYSTTTETKTAARSMLDSGTTNDYGKTRKDQMFEDIEDVRNMFWEEITSDYSNAEASVENYKLTGEIDTLYPGENFTEAWQIFLYNEGAITVTFKSNGVDLDTYTDPTIASQARDKDGKPRKAGDPMIDYGEAWRYWRDKDSLIRIIYNNYAAIGNDDSKLGNNFRIDEDGNTLTEKPQTDLTFDEQGHANGSKYAPGKDWATSKEAYDNLLYDSTALNQNLYKVLTQWATSRTAQDQFAAEEKALILANKTTSVDTVSGITVERLTKGQTFAGRFGNHTVTDDEQYVLDVVVNRVDPKAIWNFGFTVAPMHYYSNAENLKETGENALYSELADRYRNVNIGGYFDYRAFNYEGVSGYDQSKPQFVGFPHGNKDYLDKVLKASNIISVPVGAGMYQVSSVDEKAVNEWYLFDDVNGEKKLKSNADKLRYKFGDFSHNNIIYYIRNPFFYTVSGEGKPNGESSINNCKIKFIRYKVISSTKLLDSIFSGEIHYGDPNANDHNFDQINASSNTTAIPVDNNGYGYIGINPTYIPDIEVRRLIMRTINLNDIKGYYKEGLATLITRPMTTVSWASPQHADTKDPEFNNLGNTAYAKYREYYYPYDAQGVDRREGSTYNGYSIVDLMKALGYTGYDETTKKGIWYKTINGKKHECRYTFTIAGSDSDHPAYAAMEASQRVLEANGFKITLKTDPNALSALSDGKLTVWAAAWGSTIDPDMYQVYHMESKATSVKNWGYPDIITNEGGIYNEELNIIQELSDLIDKGRSVLDRESRRDTYFEALDKVMELAVELPTYQRVNLYAYRTDAIKASTLNSDVSPYQGPLARLWEVELLESAKNIKK